MKKSKVSDPVNEQLLATILKLQQELRLKQFLQLQSVELSVDNVVDNKILLAKYHYLAKIAKQQHLKASSINSVIFK